ncbi:MAG TPA: hypothetical protein VN676_12715 [Steroidobacteraceae bacterium]|nr:hypothetical protein [Steroidobacteraceae bacterium]
MNTPLRPETRRRIVSHKLLLAHDLKERPGPLLEVRHAIGYFRRTGPGKHTVSLCRAEASRLEVVRVSQKDAWKKRTADECAPPRPAREPRESRDPAPAC